MLGYLTSASQLPQGGSYQDTAASLLHADAEIALKIGIDGEVTGFGAALELVDLAGPDDPERIVAGNVFHRAVVFGPCGGTSAAGSLCRLLVDGQVRAQAAIPETDYPRVVDEVVRLLATVGERLQPGDRLITGSIVQVPVTVDDHVVADLGPLGCAKARIIREPGTDD